MILQENKPSLRLVISSKQVSRNKPLNFKKLYLRLTSEQKKLINELIYVFSSGGAK